MTQDDSAHLPPGSVPLSGMETSPVHETGSVLIRSEEQDLGILASGQVDNLLLDSGRLTGNEQVDDGVDKVFEAQGKVCIEVGQDGRLGTAFDDEAVSACGNLGLASQATNLRAILDSLLLLSAGQSVGLVEQSPRVLGIVLPASRSNDSNTTSSDVLEPDVESTEIGSDDEEDPERRQGVLDLGQEIRLKSEGEGDLGRLVKVGLEHVLVEDQQGLENLSLFVVASLSDLPDELGLFQGLFGLESLETERRGELTRLVQGRVMGHGKVDVTHPDELGVVLQGLLDELPGKGLVTEPGLDALQSFGVGRVVLVQDWRAAMARQYRLQHERPASRTHGSSKRYNSPQDGYRSAGQKSIRHTRTWLLAPRDPDPGWP